MIPRLLLWLAGGPLKAGSRWYEWIIARGGLVKWGMFVCVLCLYPLFCLMSWVRILYKTVTFSKPAVLWAPSPILTIAESSALLNGLGYRSRTLVFTVYFITSRFDYNMQPALNNPAVNPWMSGWLFLWSLLRFDIFHFFYDGGLWSGMKIVPWARWIEIPLLRLAGKRVIATAYGADVRTRQRNELWQPWNICRECPEPGRHCVCDDVAGLRISRFHRLWCNEIIAMGDMGDFVFDSRLDLVYWPVDVQQVAYAGTPPRAPGEAIVVAHSPNHRHFKGTRFIEDSIARLQAKGHNIVLDTVERVSNVEAKRRYAAADIVFAQCIIGWTGYTEIEAMAAGKPVITSMRDAGRYLAHLPDWPALSVLPETIDATLERLIGDPAERARLGEAGRRHVEAHWSYEGLAPHYRRLHERVWRDNRLLALLNRVRQDLAQGEARIRPGAPLAAEQPAEFRVWSDPEVELKRYAWGLYGLPALDPRGLLFVHGPGGAAVHPGPAALYAMTCFHGQLGTANRPDLRDRVRAAAEFIAAALAANAHGVSTLEDGRDSYVASLAWLPARGMATRALALPVLLRAWRTLGMSDMEAPTHALAKALCAPRAEGGAWVAGTGEGVFAEATPATLLQEVSVCLQAALALIEYEACTDVDWIMPRVQAATATLASRLGAASIAQIYPPERLGAENLMDDVFFVAAGAQVLGRRTRNTELERLGKSLARDFRRYRWRQFVTFKAPL